MLVARHRFPIGAAKILMMEVVEKTLPHVKESTELTLHLSPASDQVIFQINNAKSWATTNQQVWWFPPLNTNCSNLCFYGGQHCPRRLLDPPQLSQCEVSQLDATLAACLLSKVTVRLIFPPVVLLVVVKMLEVDKSWRHLIQVSSRNGIKMDIF